MVRVTIVKEIEGQPASKRKVVALKSNDQNTACFSCRNSLYAKWSSLYEENYISDLCGFYVSLCAKCIEFPNKAIGNIAGKLATLNCLEEQIERAEKTNKELDEEIKEKKQTLKKLIEEFNFRDNAIKILGAIFWLTLAYAVLHGHRLGADCWLCKYRGMFALAGVSLLIWING